MKRNEMLLRLGRLAKEAADAKKRVYWARHWLRFFLLG